MASVTETVSVTIGRNTRDVEVEGFDHGAGYPLTWRPVRQVAFFKKGGAGKLWKGTCRR